MVADNKVEEKKSWWNYKKMGVQEIGITALVLVFLGIGQFFNRGDGSLLGVGFLFLIVWIYKKIKTRK